MELSIRYKKSLQNTWLRRYTSRESLLLRLEAEWRRVPSFDSWTWHILLLDTLLHWWAVCSLLYIYSVVRRLCLFIMRGMQCFNLTRELLQPYMENAAILRDVDWKSTLHRSFRMLIRCFKLSNLTARLQRRLML